MKTSPSPLPNFALLLGIAAASTLGLAGWSAGAHAQTTAAPATTVPPAATPTIPPAASPTAAPPEVAAPGTTKAHGKSRGGRGEVSRGMGGYLASLHEKLAITPAEEPLWGTFADSMKDTNAQLGQAYRQRRDQLPSMNALDDMNSFINLEQMRLDGLKKSSSAFAALYQTMPADQKKVADKLFLSDLPGGPHHKKPKSAG